MKQLVTILFFLNFDKWISVQELIVKHELHTVFGIHCETKQKNPTNSLI